MSVDRAQPALASLEGLSIGDALGQAFFVGRGRPLDELIRERSLPSTPWRWSDDTVMAHALLGVLLERGDVDQELLATRFAARFSAEPDRGYGAVAYWLLHQLAQGRSWKEVAPEVFSGQGSMGNGAAMRVAPLGAWFADDLDRVVEAARAQSVVTHAHPEGQAGAVAVALAAAHVTRDGAPDMLLQAVIERTPVGETRRGLARAAALGRVPPEEASAVLGDGSRVLAADTVPYALWCAAGPPRSYEASMWAAIEGLRDPQSDRDTVLAIVGGVVGIRSLAPAAWRAAREPMPG